MPVSISRDGRDKTVAHVINPRTLAADVLLIIGKVSYKIANDELICKGPSSRCEVEFNWRSGKA